MSTVADRVAERRLRRRDPKEAGRVFARLLPDAPIRSTLLSALAESIEEAHGCNPGAWEVTLNLSRPFVRHNVGSVFVLSLHVDGAYVAVRPEALDADARDRLKHLQRRVQRFKIRPELRFVELAAKDLAELWPSLKAGHRAALETASRGYQQSPFSGAHSPGVVDYLATELGKELPKPSYAAARESGVEPVRRYWKIAPDERARFWPKWRTEGIASIGWTDLGDVSALSYGEFEARRGAALAAHPNWKKAGVNQVRRFSQIRHGDRVVANEGTTKVLGLGTVVEAYHFVAGEEHGHRLRVNWDDLTERSVDQPGWRKALIELSADEFEQILASAPWGGGQGQAMVARERRETPPDAAAAPCFTAEAFKILAELSATPTREFYLSHKDDFVREVEAPFQRLFHDVVSRLPAAITEHMETERNVFSRILKNDWGRGGTWDFYWGALYPKTGQRIKDSQLFVVVGGRKLEWGFSIGQYGSEQSNRFLANVGRHEPLVGHVFDGYRGRPLRFRGDAVPWPGSGVASEAQGWSRWISDAPGQGIDVRIELMPDEVLKTSASQVAQEIARAFQDLFPLVYLAESEDPAALVRRYLEEEEESVRPPQPDYPLAQAAEDCSLDANDIALWVRAVERKGQAIIYGPPGTGKTFIAQALAKHIVGGGDGFVELVQFHPSYAYEDFILGIRPKTLPSGDLTYENAKGRFVEFCERARERTGMCVLIIDEINRANLSRVFGELMYLLEYRTGEPVPLAGGLRFQIPANVRLIGTMNTADRSIALVDHALRRRFAFLRLQPNYDVLRRYHAQRASSFPIEKLVAELKALNAAINSSHYELGISFFLSPRLAEEIAHIWRMEIEPYLEEYFFDQPSKVDDYRWERVKDRIGVDA